MTPTTKVYGPTAALLLAVSLIVAGASLQEYSAIIRSSGRLARAHFEITGVSGVYTGNENIAPYQTTSGSDAATVITTVFGWMSSGQSVEFIGDFTWGGGVLLNKNAFLNFRQATITGTTSLLLTIRSKVTILGGHWIGTIPSTSIRIEGAGASDSVIDGIDAEDFKLEFITDAAHITVQNSDFHNGTMVGYYMAVNNVRGNNVFKNITFTGLAGYVIGGMYVHHYCSHNLIEGCTFDNMGYHDIYFGGAISTPPESEGTNIVRGCIFKNQQGQAALHIKCRNNEIYNNTFIDFPVYIGAVSIYSEYAYANANDNDIHHNTFTNVRCAIGLGHSGVAVSPTIQNRIHDNTFTNIGGVGGWAMALSAASTCPLSETWIYYNKFNSCETRFWITGASNIQDTVVAYNEFDITVPTIEEQALQSCTNTLIYGNAPELADYPVPLPPDLPIPPP